MEHPATPRSESRGQASGRDVTELAGAAQRLHTRDGFTREEWAWLAMFADGMTPHAIAESVAQRTGAPYHDVSRAVLDAIRRALAPTQSSIDPSGD
jgi:hypothetical protein